jgi:glyoxylate/hydroxypyruvate reductase
VSRPLQVLVAAPLSCDPVPVVEAAVAGVGEVELHHRPDLLPPQRWVADHRGEDGWERDLAQQSAWEALLADADVLLGVPGDAPAGLAAAVAAAPRLRWVQGTAAGAGEQLVAAGLSAADLARVTVTSAAGVHARPLAEFALFGLLAMAKDADRLAAAQREHRWAPRWPLRPLAGQRVLVLGLGGIGRELARMLGALGVEVVGTRRSRGGPLPEGVARVVQDDDDAVEAELAGADAVVSCLPGTGSTRGWLDARRLALLPARAVVVNVGRGTVVDTGALLAALEVGRLRGAVLDVTDPEPLPADHPLWDRTDVVISPHTAALAVDEDDSVVELFAANLVRHLRGEPLVNTVSADRGY